MITSILFAVLLQATLSPLETLAQERYQAKDWSAAMEAYQRVINEKPEDPWAHFFEAVALQELSKHGDALHELDVADKLGLPPLQSAYRRARSYAQDGQLDRAFESLDNAIGRGFGQRSLLETDAMLAPVRTDKRFAGLIDRIDRAANPCRYRSESRQFDFWIGDWDVFTALAPTTAQIATSRIESAENGCAVLEYYTQNGGYTGRSINVYDTGLQKWRQFYVDSSGSATEYTGEVRSGTMYFVAEKQSGAPFQSRMTFFNEGPDQVRQLVERSTDGVTWTKSYEGIYKRKK